MHTYTYTHTYIYIYIYIYTGNSPMAAIMRDAVFGRGDDTVGKPSSSSNFSTRAFRACPLVEITQTVPCPAIRGNGISVNSTLPPSYQKHRKYINVNKRT